MDDLPGKLILPSRQKKHFTLLKIFDNMSIPNKLLNISIKSTLNEKINETYQGKLSFLFEGNSNINIEIHNNNKN